MIGGAIANAVAFTGGNYLAKYLSGDSAAAMEKERERHDSALEAYQAAWITTNEKMKEQAKQNFTKTDYTFKLYIQEHPDARMTPPKKTKFSDFYQPSEQQKNGELFGSFEHFLSFLVNGQQTGKDLLQNWWLLEGIAATKKLSEASKVHEETAKNGLSGRQFGKYISPHRGAFLSRNSTCQPPNAVHQADLLFLPHDKLPRGRKVYKYALTVTDVASRYKEAEPITSKNSDEVAQAFQTIYKRSPLTWPKMLQVDPGREFMGAVTKEMENHKTYIRRGRTEIHCDQAIVELFNRTLAERLFGHQYAVEMRLPAGLRSTAWVKRLPEVVAALNNEVTSLTGKKPTEAIKEKAVATKPSTTYSRPVGEREKKNECAVSLPTWRVGRWYEESHGPNLVFESPLHRKVCYQTQ